MSSLRQRVARGGKKCCHAFLLSLVSLDNKSRSRTINDDTSCTKNQEKKKIKLKQISKSGVATHGILILGKKKKKIKIVFGRINNLLDWANTPNDHHILISSLMLESEKTGKKQLESRRHRHTGVKRLLGCYDKGDCRILSKYLVFFFYHKQNATEE